MEREGKEKEKLEVQMMMNQQNQNEFAKQEGYKNVNHILVHILINIVLQANIRTTRAPSEIVR